MLKVYPLLVVIASVTSYPWVYYRYDVPKSWSYVQLCYIETSSGYWPVGCFIKVNEICARPITHVPSVYSQYPLLAPPIDDDEEITTTGATEFVTVDSDTTEPSTEFSTTESFITDSSTTEFSTTESSTIEPTVDINEAGGDIFENLTTDDFSRVADTNLSITTDENDIRSVFGVTADPFESTAKIPSRELSTNQTEFEESTTDFVESTIKSINVVEEITSTVDTTTVNESTTSTVEDGVSSNDFTTKFDEPTESSVSKGTSTNDLLMINSTDRKVDTVTDQNATTPMIVLPVIKTEETTNSSSATTMESIHNKLTDDEDLIEAGSGSGDTNTDYKTFYGESLLEPRIINDEYAELINIDDDVDKLAVKAN